MDGSYKILYFQLSLFCISLAWQEPHNEQNIIEISRSTNVVPIEHQAFPSNHTETSSFMKYIQENTNVNYLFFSKDLLNKILIYILDWNEMGSFIKSN